MVSTQDSDSCDPSSILGEIITEQFEYKHSQTALLAQLVERRSYEPQVMGSNPIQSTSGVNTNLLVARPIFWSQDQLPAHAVPSGAACSG